MNFVVLLFTSKIFGSMSRVRCNAHGTVPHPQSLASSAIHLQSSCMNALNVSGEVLISLNRLLGLYQKKLKRRSLSPFIVLLSQPPSEFVSGIFSIMTSKVLPKLSELPLRNGDPPLSAWGL